MDAKTRELIQPFIKINPFEDYTIVDSLIDFNVAEPLYVFKAYYKKTNTLVDI